MPAFRTYANDADKAKTYDHRIHQAEQAPDRQRWLLQAANDIARYEAEHQPGAQTADGHNVGVPVAVSIIDSLFSSMTATEVDISVTPRGKGTEDQAYVAGAALAQEWDITKAPSRAEESVKDSLLTGIGAAKVGYEYYEQEEDVPRRDEDVDAEIQALLKEAEGADAKNVPTADEIISQVPLLESVTTVLADRIVVDYVPWDMFLWDPTAKRWGDVRWTAQKQLMHPEEVKNDPGFKAYCSSRRQSAKLRDLKADSHIDRSILGTTADVKTEDERVTVWTMYDLETGTVCTFAAGQKWLLNETVNPFAINDDMEDKNPFVPLVLRDSPRMVRGISEMQVMRDGLKESDLYHSRLGTYLERMSPKYVAKARAFTAAGKAAMKSQEYGAVVELEEGFDPTADVKPLIPPSLMSEMYQMPEKIETSLREATGVNELMRGLFPDRKRTATETTEVVSASAARQAEKRTKLERFYHGIARRILQLMQMFYEQERIVRLVDDGGEVAWKFTADDITFEFDLEISLTPKEAKSWQTRRDQALANFNILAPMAQPGPDGSSPVNVTELLRHTLAELNTPRRIISRILNLPEDQQRQVMENLQKQQASAQVNAGGVASPGLIPGPLDAKALAAATNQGTIPPEILAAAAGTTPVSPQAVETVSKSAGIR